jgi:hypothetical protein
VVASVVVVSVAPASAGAIAVVAADVADWLAAMAAAAIASGAVPLADPGVAATGVAVTATVTAITTATGVVAGVLVPFCDAGSVGPFVDAEVEASVDEAVVDFVESPFEAEDLVRERDDASVLLPALASEAGPLLASWLAELLLFAGWFAEAELRQRPLSAAEE